MYTNQNQTRHQNSISLIDICIKPLWLKFNSKIVSLLSPLTCAGKKRIYCCLMYINEQFENDNFKAFIIFKIRLYNLKSYKPLSRFDRWDQYSKPKSVNKNRMIKLSIALKYSFLTFKILINLLFHALLIIWFMLNNEQVRQTKVFS